MALTKRQKEVLDFISSFVEENGYSPSYEELAHGLSLSSLASVHKHIEGLEARNYLSRGFNRSRSIEVSPEYMEERRRAAAKPVRAGRSSVPLLGRIAAGTPVETFPEPADLEFSDFAGDEGTFALEVRGESMIEDHICPGDFVLAERVSEVRDGDIVAALVGNETTLKRFFLEPGGRVRLQPANASMAPILVDRTEVEIQGRVIAVLRKYR